jgi:hypothetical protein
MARNVFISYRRDDTGAMAERLNRAFVERFGDERIFFDRDDIEQGTEWRARVAEHVARADTVLALIGPRWQSMLDERAAAGVDDVLRFELGTALAARKTVLPVLADGAAAPAAAGLPPELRAQAQVQAAQLRSETFDDDVRALLMSLRMPWSIALGWACANSFAWMIASLLAIALRDGSDSWILNALAGAVFVLIVGGAQWLVLRRWWTRLGWLPLAQAACGGVAALALTMATAGDSGGISTPLAGLLAVLAIAAVPALTWLAMRTRIEGAGWFNVLNVISPLAVLVVFGSQLGARSGNNVLVVAMLAAVFAANLLSGTLLMLLMRRSGRRQRSTAAGPPVAGRG